LTKERETLVFSDKVQLSEGQNSCDIRLVSAILPNSMYSHIQFDFLYFCNVKNLSMAFKFRSAEKADCAKIAELINMASDGVVEYLFHDLIPEMTPVQIMAYNLEKDNYPHSYKSAIVAADGPNVVGMALSYPSSYHKITDEMIGFFPKERLEHLSDFYSSHVSDSWFLDALGVDVTCRRKGIGTKLIELTKERAKDNGYGIISLIAFADNSPALALYKVHGFQVVQEIDLEGNDYIPHHEGCLLLKSNIDI
jgi:ribosomal protein S18 acetylase RimI-like enzyme